MLDELVKYESDGSIKYMSTKELHILVPKYYEKFQMIKVEAEVTILGIFSMWFDKESDQKQFFLPGVITMCPSEKMFKTIGGEEYLYCTFRKGDTFIKSKRVVKAEYIAYALFSMYLEKGRIPDLITYDKEAFMFDIVGNVTGSKASSYNHSIFEVIYAHLARSADDVHQFYRLTSMTKPPLRLKLSNLPNVTTSLTSRLISGYLAQSITTSLNHENEFESPIEELLRQ